MCTFVYALRLRSKVWSSIEYLGDKRFNPHSVRAERLCMATAIVHREQTCSIVRIFSLIVQDLHAMNISIPIYRYIFGWHQNPVNLEYLKYLVFEAFPIKESIWTWIQSATTHITIQAPFRFSKIMFAVSHIGSHLLCCMSIGYLHSKYYCCCIQTIFFDFLALSWGRLKEHQWHIIFEFLSINTSIRLVLILCAGECNCTIN